MTKKVTITYTRQDLNTPWFWQVLSESGSSSGDKDFITQNSDTIQLNGHFAAEGYKNIITLTFTDPQIYQQWTSLIETDVVPGYVQYCEDNNITIEHSIEDI